MSIINVLSFSSTSTGADSKSSLIDARGPRFGAAITTLVLTVFLATGQIALLTWQTAVFAAASLIGLKYSPYAFLFAKLIKPRLRGEVPTEDRRPPQFAQLVGLIFTTTALLAYLLGAETVGYIVVSAALAAAFLNAAFDFCLGCEIYLLIARAKRAVTARSDREGSYNLPAL